MSGCHPMGMGCICSCHDLTPRVDKLEDLMKVLEKSIYQMDSYECDSRVLIAQLRNDFSELKKEILETRIQFINQLGNDKKPHKCPVCDGRRCVPEINNPPHLDVCLPCEGKGIVWG